MQNYIVFILSIITSLYATIITKSSFDHYSTEMIHLRLQYNSKLPSLEFLSPNIRKTDIRPADFLLHTQHQIPLCHLHQPNILLVEIVGMIVIIELIEIGVRISYETNVWIIENQRIIDLFAFQGTFMVPNQNPKENISQKDLIQKCITLCE